MMVNIETRVSPVNVVFSSSRNAALFELEILQYTTLSIKLQHCTLSGTEIQVFTVSDVLGCVSIHCVDQKQQSLPDFSTKSFDNTSQWCVDTANE